MGLKTWLVGLGLFGATHGAVAQTGEQKADDKQDNKVETATGGTSEEVEMTPAFHHTKFQFRFEEDEDDLPTVKVDIPLAKKKYHKAAMKSLGINKDSLFNTRHEADEDDELPVKDSTPKRSATSARGSNSQKDERSTNTVTGNIIEMREKFMHDAER